MSEIYQPIALILLLSILTSKSFWSQVSFEDIIIGKVWFSPKKVYLKCWGKGFKSTFSGFMIDGGVGSIFGN